MVTAQKEAVVLYGTQEAVTYLQQKHPHIHITLDMFTHRVTRGTVPYTILRSSSGVVRWQFQQKDLDAIQFRQTHKQQPHEYFYIHTASDMHRMMELYGECVDEEGFLAALEKKYGYRFSRGSIKQRRHRGTILIAGESGGKRKQYWYPLSQLDYLKFQPNAAFLQRKRHLKRVDSV